MASPAVDDAAAKKEPVGGAWLFKEKKIDGVMVVCSTERGRQAASRKDTPSKETT